MMKNKILYIIALISASFLLTSCEKDEIQSTDSSKLAGEWYVTCVAVDENDDLVYGDDDLYGLGYFLLDTYNTSDNSSTEMWIDDNGNFWSFKNKISVNLNDLTFSATDAYEEYYGITVTITNGQVLYDAATTPSGSVADSIVFNVTFSDDSNPEYYGWDSYRIAGYRYTGLTNDD
jgi:hypothetical protein